MPDKGDLTRTANELRVPAHLIEGLVSYAVSHTPTGGFLESVLCNDLKESLRKADQKSLSGLVPLVSFIIHYLPFECQGSPEKVRAWLLSKPSSATSRLSTLSSSERSDISSAERSLPPKTS